MKKLFLHGLTAGALAALAGSIYYTIYQGTMMTDFVSVINIGSIIGASVFGCMLMSLGYFALHKFRKSSLVGWLNLLICLLSFASIISPISMGLPLDVEYPDLFPGLVVPMHFFPAISFFAIAPFFTNNSRTADLEKA